MWSVKVPPENVSALPRNRSAFRLRVAPVLKITVPELTSAVSANAGPMALSQLVPVSQELLVPPAQVTFAAWLATTPKKRGDQGNETGGADGDCGKS